MKNYCTETDLKSYFPELDLYKWSGMTDFSQFKQGATEKVCIDLKNKGYDIRKLQTPLILINNTYTVSGESNGIEDKTNRLRLVYNVTATTGDNSFILQGSSDNTNWYDIQGVTIEETGESSVSFSDAYKYYRVAYTIGGSLTAHIYLVETNYDVLFCYKQLELIMLNGSKDPNDKWWNKMLYFRDEYNVQLGSMVISYDSDDSGEIEDGEKMTTNIVEYLR